MIGFDRSISDSGEVSQLFSDFEHHFIGSGSDGFHTHGREPIRKHRSNQKSEEDKGVNDVDFSNSERLLGVGRSGDESSIKSNGNETSRSDGESFSDSGGGVSSGVEGISSLSGLFSHFAHFSDSSSVIRNGSISINGKSKREVSEHTEGSEGNSEHT